MADSSKLVIVVSRGFDDERSSVAWSIANAGVASDMEVTMFLVSAGVDWVRKGGAEVARLNLMSNGGKVLVCPPCAKVRGYGEAEFIDGVTIAGAPAMLEVVKQGAATLTF